MFSESNKFSRVRTLWISEERELVHEIAGLGELREPWHSSQMSWLENHLNLINTYTTALENLNNYRGKQLLVFFFHLIINIFRCKL